jgi:hypothetical protein
MYIFYKKKFEALLLMSSLAVIIGHSFLIPLARWHPDEFAIFAKFNLTGWSGVSERILVWSPRPFSEVFLFGYSRLVILIEEPVPATIIALTWAAVLAILVLASRVARVSIALPVSLMAAAILAGRPGEMWFWTAAALAYLPSFAGIGAAAILMVGTTRGRLHDATLAGSLLLAAGSSEVGALATAAFTTAMLARALAGKFGLLRPAEIASWAWIIPALLAFTVLVLLAMGRAGSESEALGDAGIRGRVFPSMLAAAKVSWPMFAGVSVEPHGRRVVWLGLIFKFLLALGFWAAMPPSARNKERIIERMIFSISLILIAFLSLALAYYQFGDRCCPRHDAFRQSLIVISLFLLGGSLASFYDIRRQARLSRLLIAALATIFAGILWVRGPSIRYDFALITHTREIIAANWISGRAPGHTMEFASPPVGRLTGGWILPPGEFRRSDPDAGRHWNAQSWHVLAVLTYFNKSELRSLGEATLVPPLAPGRN